MAICIEDGNNFDVTGHYPILAGLDPSGEPLYVALTADDPRAVSCVKNGASTASFTDRNGETLGVVRVDRFYILVLRHNPSDWYAHNETDIRDIPADATDPTGPVFWLKDWPKRESSLPDDPHITEKHQHYELCLSILKMHLKSDDSELEVEKKLKKALTSVELFEQGRITDPFKTSQHDREESDDASYPTYETVTSRSRPPAARFSGLFVDSVVTGTEGREDPFSIQESATERLNRLERDVDILRREIRILRAEGIAHESDVPMQ